MAELIRGFIDAESRLVLLLPGEGYCTARVESLVGDVVTIVPEGRPKIVIHYTQFALKL